MYRCVQVCLNGHIIQSRTRLSKTVFCEKCGAKMIDECPVCHTPIEEWDWTDMVVIGDFPYERANYCRACGSPYPWTQTAIEVAADLISEEEELDNVQQEKLISSLPDIIAGTPKTQTAVVRLKKALLTVGKFTADGLRQFVIDFGCELAKNQLGL